MKEKLAQLWMGIKAHKAQIIKASAVLVGAAIGVAVGAMFSGDDEVVEPLFVEDDLGPDEVEIEESEEIDDEEDEAQEE